MWVFQKKFPTSIPITSTLRGEQPTSRPGDLHSKIKGDSSSDTIERVTQLICRQKTNFHSARSYLPSSGKVLGLNRDLLTDILTVCQDLWIYFRCLQLREVLCQLPMLYLLRFYVYLPDVKRSVLFILA